MQKVSNTTGMRQIFPSWRVLWHGGTGGWPWCWRRLTARGLSLTPGGNIWMKAFADCGVDPEFYTTRERDLDEIFPWDFIDAGVSKEFLKREWLQAVAEQVTPNCRERCSGCGARGFGGGVCYENQN